MATSSRAHGPRRRRDARPVDGAAGRELAETIRRRARSALQRRPRASNAAAVACSSRRATGRPPVSRAWWRIWRSRREPAPASARRDRSARRARPRRARRSTRRPRSLAETTGTRSRRTSRRWRRKHVEPRMPIRRCGSWLIAGGELAGVVDCAWKTWARGTCGWLDVRCRLARAAGSALALLLTRAFREFYAAWGAHASSSTSTPRTRRARRGSTSAQACGMHRRDLREGAVSGRPVAGRSGEPAARPLPRLPHADCGRDRRRSTSATPAGATFRAGTRSRSPGLGPRWGGDGRGRADRRSRIRRRRRCEEATLAEQSLAVAAALPGPAAACSAAAAARTSGLSRVSARATVVSRWSGSTPTAISTRPRARRAATSGVWRCAC